MAIPFALSLLTRPCKIFIELQDRAARARADAPRRERRRPRARARRLLPADRQSRRVDVHASACPASRTFRLGLEIQNGYLVFSNIPWSDTMTIDRVETRTLNGAAIQVRPDAVKLGLASLFATQAEQDQAAALTSMAALYPLLKTIAATPAEAAATHAALFGTTPLHPGQAGEWIWTNGQLESSEYGTARRWKAPAFDPALGELRALQRRDAARSDDAVRAGRIAGDRALAVEGSRPRRGDRVYSKSQPTVLTPASVRGVPDRVRADRPHVRGSLRPISPDGAYDL